MGPRVTMWIKGVQTTTCYNTIFYIVLASTRVPISDSV